MVLFPVFPIALITLVGQPISLMTTPSPIPLWLSQKTTAVTNLLLKLSRPPGSPSKVQTLFMANAYQQQGLNFQAKGLPAPTVEFYRSTLAKAGYQERPVNTTQGDWGFSMVFDPPATVTLAPKDTTKTVVLVIQGTMLGPETINLNLRFEEI